MHRCLSCRRAHCSVDGIKLLHVQLCGAHGKPVQACLLKADYCCPDSRNRRAPKGPHTCPSAGASAGSLLWVAQRCSWCGCTWAALPQAPCPRPSCSMDQSVTEPHPHTPCQAAVCAHFRPAKNPPPYVCGNHLTLAGCGSGAAAAAEPHAQHQPLQCALRAGFARGHRGPRGHAHRDALGEPGGTGEPVGK